MGLKHDSVLERKTGDISSDRRRLELTVSLVHDRPEQLGFTGHSELTSQSNIVIL